jgi:uncharacterized membrane protein YvbJ
MPRKPSEDWFACPCCGAEVACGASFCRQCGASEDSGWGDETDDYGEDDDFDYDEFVRREFPEHAPPGTKYPPRKVLMAILVVLLCIALLLWTLW